MVSAEYRHSVIFISLIRDRDSLRFFSDCSSWFQSKQKRRSVHLLPISETATNSATNFLSAYCLYSTRHLDFEEGQPRQLLLEGLQAVGSDAHHADPLNVLQFLA